MNHAIIFTQDKEWVQNLPRAPKECKMITVNFNSRVAEKTKKTMKVRRSVVTRALKWLTTHNFAFKKHRITISEEKLALYEGNPNLLSLLPEEKTIPEHAPTTTDEEAKE